MESVATGYIGIGRENVEELKGKYGLLDTFAYKEQRGIKPSHHRTLDQETTRS